jgi:redox-sensitive bicupin YhaK (pirin superfamily)
MALDPQRKAYVHLVRGELQINGQQISAGDALLLESESEITIDQASDAEVLVFDLAA